MTEIALGVLQGLTEFLPISSDGHLALAEMLWNTSPGGLWLNVMLHAGTLLSTLLVLRRQIFELAQEAVRGLGCPRRWLVTSAGRDLLTVLLASLPTAGLGLLLRHPAERWTGSPLMVGLGFHLTALAVVSAHWARPGHGSHPTPWGAIVLGIGQGLAVLPGVSRSGLTIALGLWLGLRSERAFELSMLMSLPAVLGALGLELAATAEPPRAAGAAALGASAALVTGVIALVIVRRFVVKGWFPWFAIWTFAVGTATLALAAAWPD